MSVVCLIFDTTQALFIRFYVHLPHMQVRHGAQLRVTDTTLRMDFTPEHPILLTAEEGSGVVLERVAVSSPVWHDHAVSMGCEGTMLGLLGKGCVCEASDCTFSYRGAYEGVIACAVAGAKLTLNQCVTGRGRLQCGRTSMSATLALRHTS